jgi:ATP-binding cassette subfamily E protein 1
MGPKNKKKDADDGELTRVAIVNDQKCKPKKCRQECKKMCPVVRQGKECIEALPNSKLAYISEELCIGCGICVKKCPFEAITIINLPKSLASQQTHRYGPNSFKLHRLPTPRPGQVLGLVGTNGIGKSTALKILAGKQKPNLGSFEREPDWAEILVYFRGSELQNYFTKILEDNLKAIIKPQYVDHIPKAISGKVEEIMIQKNQRDNVADIMTVLDLNHIKDREINVLSGGELQRFAIGVVIVQEADVYMFDEPSSYLDVKQRLVAARTIRALTSGDWGSAKYVLAVEHDLAILDYLSDFICVLYGTPSAYGVVTMPFSVREGINIFLAGFVPTENLRFREEELNFKMSVDYGLEEEAGAKKSDMYQYPSMTKTMTGKGDNTSMKFVLHVEAGSFTDSEIVVMLGENGTGKTTFIRMLAGLLKSDEQAAALEDGDEFLAAQLGVPTMNVSYKPQMIAPKFQGTVRQLLHKKVRDAYIHPQFSSDVMKPMSMEVLMDNGVQNLSGGELQRTAIVLCLGTAADIYLIDEPSAYLDSEQRIAASKVIKKFIMHAKKTAFVVEHDFIMATYLADKVVVYDGQPGIETTAQAPQSLIPGMNTFLKMLNITFRRDPTNYRPRINKCDSVKDQEQKKSGSYFYVDEDD